MAVNINMKDMQRDRVLLTGSCKRGKASHAGFASLWYTYEKKI